jgi:CHRD domain/PEP-CTERM motif
MHKTLLAAVIALACGTANAAIDSYWAALSGNNEVSNGDPDGFGLALVSIDTMTNSVSWAIQVGNIVLPLTLAHIHQAPAGVNGPVKIDFDAQLTGVVTDADAALITPLTASGFYVNLHNEFHPGGAVRGQLAYVGSVNVVPEPETYALMLAGLSAVGWMVRRRRGGR